MPLEDIVREPIDSPLVGSSTSSRSDFEAGLTLPKTPSTQPTPVADPTTTTPTPTSTDDKGKIIPLDDPKAVSVPDAEEVVARKEVQENLEDPMKTLSGQGLLQEAVELKVKEDEILDPVKHLAEQVTATPVTEAAVGVVRTASQVAAMETAAAQLPAGEQVQVASDVSYTAAVVADLPDAEQAQAAEDIMVENYELSLLTPEDMGKNLEKLQAEEPMIAASMTTEMNLLLDGMENGEIPLWAKPAVTMVENQLAARGLTASSIARDSLFNAIIQAAMPIAQTNAQFQQDAAKTNYNAKIQAIFSDTAAENAARNFNASTINQKNQFMTNLKAQVASQDAARKDAMATFNVGESNVFTRERAATDVKLALFSTEAANINARFNATQANQLSTFQAGLDSQRQQFNAQMASAIEQSNVAWRKQANQINTAIGNQVNQTNTMNAFNLSNQALSFLWQEERDEAHWEFQADEAALNRRNQLEANVIANETAAAGEVGSWLVNLTDGLNIIDRIKGTI